MLDSDKFVMRRGSKPGNPRLRVQEWKLIQKEFKPSPPPPPSPPHQNSILPPPFRQESKKLIIFQLAPWLKTPPKTPKSRRYFVLSIIIERVDFPTILSSQPYNFFPARLLDAKFATEKTIIQHSNYNFHLVFSLCMVSLSNERTPANENKGLFLLSLKSHWICHQCSCWIKIFFFSANILWEEMESRSLIIFLGMVTDKQKI